MKHMKTSSKEMVIGSAKIVDNKLRSIRLITIKNQIILHRTLKVLNEIDINESKTISFEGILYNNRELELITYSLRV